MPEGNPALQRSAPTEVRHCKKPRPPSRPTQIALHTSATETTARGFEPLRAEPNGFRVHLLNRSSLRPRQRAQATSSEAPCLPGAASRLPASVLRRLGGAGRARCSTVVGRSRGSLLSSGCQRPAAHHTCASDSRGKMLARRDEQAAAAMCFPRATGHDLRHTSRRQRQITHTGSRAWRCFALATAHGAQQEQALQSLSHAQPRGLWRGAACLAKPEKARQPAD